MKRKIFLILTITLLIASTQAVFADWQKGENNRYKYFNSATGQYVVNNWIQTGNGFYYFDAYGYAVTGWYQINGKYYYFDRNGYLATNQWIDDEYFVEDITRDLIYSEMLGIEPTPVSIRISINDFLHEYPQTRIVEDISDNGKMFDDLNNISLTLDLLKKQKLGSI